MPELPWERLPDNTTETCDTIHTTAEQKKQYGLDTFGWNRNPTTPNRCGKKASWIDRSTCGCGACDMTISECDEHYQKRTKEAEERNKKFDAKFEVVEKKLPGGMVQYTKRRRLDRQ